MRALFLFTLFISNNIFADTIFQLTEKSWWIYHIDGAQDHRVTNKVSDMKTIKGIDWYLLEEYGESYWIRNNKMGQIEAVNFFETIPTEQSIAQEQLIFKFPAAIGDTWNTYGSPTTYSGLQNIKVPAGRFDCHMYKIDMGKGDYSKSCIAEGVGVIYNEAILNGNPKEVSRLVKYGL